jgi:hypothetical protein
MRVQLSGVRFFALLFYIYNYRRSSIVFQVEFKRPTLYVCSEFHVAHCMGQDNSDPNYHSEEGHLFPT